MAERTLVERAEIGSQLFAIRASRQKRQSLVSHCSLAVVKVGRCVGDLARELCAVVASMHKSCTSATRGKDRRLHQPHSTSHVLALPLPASVALADQIFTRGSNQMCRDHGAASFTRWGKRVGHVASHLHLPVLPPLGQQ